MNHNRHWTIAMVMLLIYPGYSALRLIAFKTGTIVHCSSMRSEFGFDYKMRRYDQDSPYNK